MARSWDSWAALKPVLGPTGADLGPLGGLGRSLGVDWGGLRVLLGAHGAVLPRLGTVWTPKKYFHREKLSFVRTHFSDPNQLPRAIMITLAHILESFESILGPSETS